MLLNNIELYDIATRKAVYVEGVKAYQSREFDLVLAELTVELRSLLGRVKYRTLDGLTKAELNRLIVALRETQSRLYSRYTDKLVKMLREFMTADLEVSRQVFATARRQAEDEEAGGELLTDAEAIALIAGGEFSEGATALFGLAAVVRDDSRLWSSINNAPIPANGLYLLPFIKTFAVSAQAGVENFIRKAWANGLTVEETLAELVGGSAVQGTGNQMQRVAVQASAVVATAVGHVSAIATAAVQSALFRWYEWISVMDGKTTDICIGRNRRRYRFGEGPLPPAHIRCRSHIVPVVVGIDDLPDETFYTWLKRQPTDVQDDVLGERAGEEFRKGNIKAKDLPKLNDVQPLNLKQFRAKIRRILSRRYSVAA